MMSIHFCNLVSSHFRQVAHGVGSNVQREPLDYLYLAAKPEGKHQYMRSRTFPKSTCIVAALYQPCISLRALS